MLVQFLFFIAPNPVQIWCKNREIFTVVVPDLVQISVATHNNKGSLIDYFADCEALLWRGRGTYVRTLQNRRRVTKKSDPVFGLEDAVDCAQKYHRSDMYP